jgi:hypothetical protein
VPGASLQELKAAYKAAHDCVGYVPQVEALWHIGDILWGGHRWHAEAAQLLDIAPEQLTGWLAGNPPPDWLGSRLSVFVPMLRDRAVALHLVAKRAEILADFLQSRREETRRRCDRKARPRRGRR